MNLSATRPRLEMLAKELGRTWDNTKNVWRDAKAEEFQSTYLEELLARVDKASAAIDKLDHLLTKVKGDCE